jgi:hypothetical protein
VWRVGSAEGPGETPARRVKVPKSPCTGTSPAAGKTARPPWRVISLAARRQEASGSRGLASVRRRAASGARGLASVRRRAASGARVRGPVRRRAASGARVRGPVRRQAASGARGSAPVRRRAASGARVRGPVRRQAASGARVRGPVRRRAASGARVRGPVRRRAASGSRGPAPLRRQPPTEEPADPVGEEVARHQGIGRGGDNTGQLMCPQHPRGARVQQLLVIDAPAPPAYRRPNTSEQAGRR